MFKKEKSNISGKEFVKLVTSFTKSLKEAKCSEIFNHLTKKPENESRVAFGAEANDRLRPNTAQIDRNMGVTSP